MGVSTQREKLWDLAMKAAVPLSIILGGAIIAHEVKIGRHEERLEDVEQRVEHFDSRWLRESVDEIKGTLRTMDTRLRELERVKR